MLNPIHHLIDLLAQLYDAFDAFQRSETPEEIERRKDDWVAIVRGFWETHKFPENAVRNLSDPIIEWCAKRGIYNNENRAIIHEAAAIAIELTKITIPLHPDRLEPEPNENWKTWKDQGSLADAALAAKNKMRQLAAEAGERWNPDRATAESSLQEDGKSPAAAADTFDIDAAMHTQIERQQQRDREETERQRILNTRKAAWARMKPFADHLFKLLSTGPSDSLDERMAAPDWAPAVADNMIEFVRIAVSEGYSSWFDDRNHDNATRTMLRLYRIAKDRNREELIARLIQLRLAANRHNVIMYLWERAYALADGQPELAPYPPTTELTEPPESESSELALPQPPAENERPAGPITIQTSPPESETPKKKRSTVKGEGQAKLISVLTAHHKYAEGGFLNLEPIGNNELAKKAEVSPSTASAFFTKAFQGFDNYRVVCRNAVRLAESLKVLNGEFCPHELYGRRPPGEDDRDDERDN